MLKFIAKLLGPLLAVMVSWQSNARATECVYPKDGVATKSEYEEVLANWTRSSDEYNPKELARRVRLCLIGSDVARDVDDVIAWLRKASDLGVLEAQVLLAMNLSHKLATFPALGHEERTEIEREIEHLLTNSMDAGHQFAGIILGVFYITGILGEPSKGYGFALLEDISNSGNSFATRILPELRAKYNRD